MLQILNAPHTTLSTKASFVKKVDSQILKLIGDMTKSLEAASDPVGVGLAAPQVGKSLQLFIAKPNLKSKIFVFINPKIITHLPIKKAREERVRKLEGCLSLKDIWGEVERYPEIAVKYLDEKANLHNRKFTGFMATVIQHEMDHLEGVLFPKKVLEQKGKLYKSEKDKKGEDFFEEIKI